MANRHMKICSTSLTINIGVSCSAVSTLYDPMDSSTPAPLFVGFSRQEYWSGLPCPPPGDLPNPGIEPMSLRSPVLAGGFFTTSTTWEAQLCSVDMN